MAVERAYELVDKIAISEKKKISPFTRVVLPYVNCDLNIFHKVHHESD